MRLLVWLAGSLLLESLGASRYTGGIASSVLLQLQPLTTVAAFSIPRATTSTRRPEQHQLSSGRGKAKERNDMDDSNRTLFFANNAGTDFSGTLQSTQDILQCMEQPTGSSSSSYANNQNGNIAVDNETLNLVHTIVKAADGRKADQIMAWMVQHVTTLTSVVVVVSGNSRPQNQAIGNAVRQAVQEYEIAASATKSGATATLTAGGPTTSIEGTAESGWMLLDYGSVMVHIMTPKSRLFYNIEGQWKNTAVALDLSNILIPNTVPNPAALENATMDDDEYDNFNNGGAAPISMRDSPTPVETEDDPFWS